MLALREVGLVTVATGHWLGAVAVTGVVQLGLWLIPHSGLSERLEWDPHFLYIPMAAAALLLGYYTYLAPSARYLLLMAWFVALIFMAGLAGFGQVVLLGGVMMCSWLVALVLRNIQGTEYRLDYQVAQSAVFLAVQVYAGFVFERLRRDRRKMQDLRRRLAEQAATDSLTGVANRRYFEEFLRSEIARIDRYGGSCAVAMVDVDRFKNYNDALGHPAGDEVLCQLTALFQGLSRDADLVARYGGEEFALVHPATTREEAIESARRIQRVVEDHPFPREEIQPGGKITVSIGVAAYPEDARTLEELVSLSDRALYRAKAEGRNRVRSAADL